MFFNFVFMFLWFYPPSAKTETKDTYKIPCRLYVNRGHFYFGQRGQPYFGFGGQINLGPRGHPRLGFPLDRHFMELQKASVKASSPTRQSTVQQPAVTVSVPKIDNSPVEEQGWSCGGDNETWPEFRARHSDLSAAEALRRFRAKKRGGRINGGFHM